MKRAQSEKDRENDVISVMAKIKFKSVNDNVPITQKVNFIKYFYYMIMLFVMIF